MAQKAKEGDKIILEMTYHEGKVLFDWLTWIKDICTLRQYGPVGKKLYELYGKD